MRTFNNLVIQYTAVVILTRADAVEKLAFFFAETHCNIPKILMTPKINSFEVSFAHRCVCIYIYLNNWQWPTAKIVFYIMRSQFH
jgi:hypothetical protein